MPDKIGDVYDGDRKIGELHRSGGGLGLEGCLIGLVTLGLLIAGGFILLVDGINQIRYGADSPADATMTAQAPNCSSSQPANPPSMDSIENMIAQAYKQTYDVAQVQRAWIIKQSGCSMNVCATALVTNYDGSNPQKLTGDFTFTYGYGSISNATVTAEWLWQWGITGGNVQDPELGNPAPQECN